MDSDVCITDFDSDDENVIWPQSQNVTDDDDYLDSENIATSRHLWQARCIREFGECVDNNNWVECRSKSRPDLLYFHNTHSGCSTWHRPVSRYVDVPFVSIQRVNCADDDVTASDLELMSVSDSEKGPSAMKSSMKTLDVISRCYYVPRMDPLASDTSDLDEPVNAFADECCNNDDGQNGANEGRDSNSEGMETEQSPFHVTDFLETELFVGENEIGTERTPRIIERSTNDSDSSLASSSRSPAYNKPRRVPRVYRVPRLKRIGREEQIIKQRAPRVCKNREGFGTIICHMYGVKTINYNPLEPHMVDQTKMHTGLGVKVSRLSDSDSDDVGDESSPKRSQSWQLHNFDKDFRQPLLSDTSSSSSSSQSESDSSSSGSTSTCSTCTCSTCTSCTTNN